jgi:hypothetical protein
VQTARILVIGTVTTLAIGLGAAPAAAAPTGDTAVTFEIAEGTLDIVVDAAADLGPLVPGQAGGGSLGPVSVSDTRAAATGTWTVGVTATAFNNGGVAASSTVPVALIDYWSGPATTPATGNGTFTPGQVDLAAADPFSGPVVAYDRAGGSGNSSVTWTPELVFRLPLTNESGDYTGTVTHSVS